jgi:hypothetical protein
MASLSLSAQAGSRLSPQTTSISTEKIKIFWFLVTIHLLGSNKN